MMLGAVTLCLGCTLVGYGQDHVKRDNAEMHRLHNDSTAYIAMLEGSERDSYQKPEKVLEALNLSGSEIVADIGSGSGYFALRLAHGVAESGQVYGVDVNPDMIRHLNRRIRDSGILNLRTVLAPPDDPLLPSASLDLVFICDTWHHIQDRPGYLELLKQALKPGGRVVMIDFKKEPLPIGPGLEHKIASAALIEEMADSGFSIVERHTFLPYQYFLVFAVR